MWSGVSVLLIETVKFDSIRQKRLAKSLLDMMVLNESQLLVYWYAQLLFHCEQSTFKHSMLTLLTDGTTRMNAGAQKEGWGLRSVAQYINMSEFTCTRDPMTSSSCIFCYFCLKAGAWRSRISGSRQNKHGDSTVLSFHHITKGREAGKRSLCQERTTYRGFIQNVYKERYWASESAAEGRSWGHTIPFSLSGLIRMSRSNQREETCWIRFRLEVSESTDGDRWELLPIKQWVWVRGGGSVTVGASGGQPQANTSLCLLKLKCLFCFPSFPYITLYMLYNTHWIATASPAGVEETTDVQYIQ